jgi:hypothetical protein
MNQKSKNPKNLSDQPVFLLSSRRVGHTENFADEKKPEKTAGF